jgi:hypothetical protein
MLLLLLVLAVVEALLLPRVHFHVTNYEYIQLCAGEPCTWLTFKLDRSSNEIWLHNQAYIALSQTYHHALNGARESEFFYFDTYRLRLHLALHPATPSTLYLPPVAYDGTFGLGSQAEIWAFWDNYTLSTTRLELGGYLNYAQRHPHEHPPILDLNEGHDVILGDGTEATLKFNLNRIESFVPYNADINTALQAVKIKARNCLAYYDHLGIEGGPSCSNEQTIHSDAFQSLTLTNGVHYQAVSYSDDNSLIVGTHFIDELVVFHGISCHCAILAEDAFSLNYVALMATLSLILFGFLSLWIVIAESPVDRENEWEFRLMISVELFCYLIDILLYYTAFHMLDWGRYISQYAECSPVFAEIYLAILFVVSLGCLLHTSFPWENYQEYLRRFRKNLMFHLPVFTLLQTSFVWLAIIEEHEITFSRILLAIVLTAALLLGTVALGRLYLKNKQMEFGILFVLLATGYAFLTVYSLIPMFTYAHIRHPMGVSVFMWIFFFIAMPALLVFSSYELIAHWKQVKKLT